VTIVQVIENNERLVSPEMRCGDCGGAYPYTLEVKSVVFSGPAFGSQRPCLATHLEHA